jgi:hypothetical protein
MKKTAQKKDSFGTVTAAKGRARANGLSDERREELMRRAMSLIYGADSSPQVKTHGRRG